MVSEEWGLLLPGRVGLYCHEVQDWTVTKYRIGSQMPWRFDWDEVVSWVLGVVLLGA